MTRFLLSMVLGVSAALGLLLPLSLGETVFHVWRDKLSSITYSEELIFSMSASL
jgi:hypothetical protein